MWLIRGFSVATQEFLPTLHEQTPFLPVDSFCLTPTHSFSLLSKSFGRLLKTPPNQDDILPFASATPHYPSNSASGCPPSRN